MDFVATQHSTVEDKKLFATRFIDFVESGFERRYFTKEFYKRLSMCFGHIAHYNQEGFWLEWFSSPDAQRDFMDHTVKWGCFGDPKFTYSDVEKYLVNYFKEHPVKI